MSNEATDIDIRASANEVTALLRQGKSAEAFARLDTLREGERPAVQEALDRFVTQGARDQLANLARSGAANDPNTGAVNPNLLRLEAARGDPRMPTNPHGDPTHSELHNLTDTQRHDVYASMVQTRGNDAARTALAGGDRVILGLRQEDSTLVAGVSGSAHLPRTDDPATKTRDESKGGTGVYNDRLVVLWENPNGTRGVHEVLRASTEPTAQYDAHYAKDKSVQFRRGEGADVNADKVTDLGRLAPGTIEMLGAKHGSDLHFSLRPTPEAVAAGAGMVQRDTNGDGRFDSADENGAQHLNATFKIHRGSSNNTDSAGCQTVHSTRDDHGMYDQFVTELKGSGAQNRWQYVLTHTTPSTAPAVERTPGAATPNGTEPAPESSSRSSTSDATTDALFERLSQASQSNDPQAMRAALEAIAHAPVGQELDQQAQQLLEEQARETTSAPQPERDPRERQIEAPVMQR